MFRLFQSPCVTDRCPWAFRSGRLQSHRSHCSRLSLHCSSASDIADGIGISRRHLINIGTVLSTGVASGLFEDKPSMALPASKGQTPSVGSYLPSAGVEDFVEFVPGPQKTPVRMFPCHPRVKTRPRIRTKVIRRRTRLSSTH